MNAVNSVKRRAALLRLAVAVGVPDATLVDIAQCATSDLVRYERNISVCLGEMTG